MRSLLFIFVVILGYASTALSQGVSINFNPIADAFVSSANPDSNFGGAGALAVSASGSDGIFDTVMKFDLSSVAGMSIQSITLQLSAASAVANPIFNPDEAGLFSIIWMQDSSWVEGTGMPRSPTTDGITYDTLPDYLGPSDESFGTFTYAGDTGQADTYTLQLTPDFLSAVSTDGTVSFEIVPADSNVSYVFNSKDFSNPADHPVLTLTVAPEPAAAPLLGLGLLLLAAGRWRRLRRS